MRVVCAGDGVGGVSQLGGDRGGEGCEREIGDESNVGVVVSLIQNEVVGVWSSDGKSRESGMGFSMAGSREDVFSRDNAGLRKKKEKLTYQK